MKQPTEVGYFISGDHAGLMGAAKAALPVAIHALRMRGYTADEMSANELERFAAMLEDVHNEVVIRQPRPTWQEIERSETEAAARDTRHVFDSSISLEMD
jgi:hypothetical protein